MSAEAKAAVPPSLELDAQETKEWLDALSAVIDREGPERAHYLLEQLLEQATKLLHFIRREPAHFMRHQGTVLQPLDIEQIDQADEPALLQGLDLMDDCRGELIRIMEAKDEHLNWSHFDHGFAFAGCSPEREFCLERWKIHRYDLH